MTSLLERSQQQWRQAAGSRVREPALFLLDARDEVESLQDGTGWEVEYRRDVWCLHTLPGVAAPSGRPCPRARLRFDRNTHCSFGRSRVNDCETFGIEPIEGAEANDGIERPELGEFRQSIVIQLDKFSIRRGGEPRPLSLEGSGIAIRNHETQASIGHERLQAGRLP